MKRPSILTSYSDQWLYIEIRTTVVADTDTTTPLMLDPNRLAMYKTPGVDLRTAEFELTNVSARTRILSLVDWPGDLISVTLPYLIAPAGTKIGTVRLIPPEEVPPFEESFTFEVNDPGRSRFTVPVVRQILVSGEYDSPSPPLVDCAD